MPGPRIPPALAVFPTLRRFPIFRPRHIPEVPAGCAQRSVNDEFVKRSLLHLYHDLGVLVFAGATPAQVTRIGDILREVVRRGGPGGMASDLQRVTTRTSRWRNKALSKKDLYETLDATRAGVVKPEAILRLASSRLQELLRSQLQSSDSEGQGRIHIRESQVMLPGLPQPRGTILETINGPRRLPIESFAALSISSGSGRTSGEVQFYAAGTGEYVGGARIDYVLLRYDRAAEEMRPYWAHGALDKRQERDKAAQRVVADAMLDTALVKLWQLEREVWASRAEELETEKAK